MSDIINLLPDSVANQIAAGEVVQRPSSVVKELVENAIDAGATAIDILVKDAGRTSIRIIDNGKGMSCTDARLAFERHATSKINKAEDLFNLQTMGFRGEALASIAAVAQVELKTRQEGSELGTHISISGSKVENQEAVSCPTGCQFTVNNLFFNIPARRRFLKSDKTELSNILTEFERIALVYPSIAFTLHHNESELINLPIGNRRQRIVHIFGKKINSQLIDVKVETTIAHITGLIGKPDTSKKKGLHQYFFVNGRYMRHPYFHRAVMGAFDGMIPEGEQISYFLYFQIDPANIDVNIHPTKTEIKFENEQAIWQLIQAALRESIGKYSSIPSIDFDTADRPEIPMFNSGNEEISLPKPQFDTSFNPFQTHSGYESKTTPRNWEEFYSSAQNHAKEDEEYTIIGNNKEKDTFVSLFTADEEWLNAEKSSYYYQYKGRYILTSVKSGLMIIDQRRAHIRILYDQYLNQLEQHTGHSQGMLFPEIIEFSSSEVALFEEIVNDLTAIGFEFSALGGGSYAVNGIPSEAVGLSPINLLRAIMDSALDHTHRAKQEIHTLIATSLAKSAALVHGQVLNNEEMSHIVDTLFACQVPNFTPDGKKVFSTILQADLDHFLE